MKEERTDTGIVLPKLSTLVYIELDKCLAYVRKHGYPEEAYVGNIVEVMKMNPEFTDLEVVNAL